MTVPIIGWVSQALISKLGVSVTVEFASQLAEIIQHSDEKTIQEYELTIRNQTINNLNKTKLEIKDIMYLNQYKNDDSLKRNLYLLSRQISSLSDKISFSGLIDNRLSEENKKKIIYINTLILSDSYSILSNIKNMADTSYENNIENNKTELIRRYIRDIENILEIKTITQNYEEEDISYFLSENNPDLFVKIRALTGIIYRMEEMKKPLIYQSKYHEKIQGYTLYILDEVIKKRGPIISLTQLYLDFKKEYPNIEVNQLDFEKSINTLVEQGMIENIKATGEGYKIVKIKPLMLTDYYQTIIDLLTKNTNYLENGLSKEDITLNLGYDPNVTDSVLSEMEKNDLAWEHQGKYYFPGLAESAYKLKVKTLEVA
jgi:hypothetical protein